MAHVAAIYALANATVTVKRRIENPRIDGKTQAPTIETETARAVVVPATGEQLKRLPEGRSTVGVFAIYTEKELRAGTSGILSDLITYESNDYEVEHVAKYSGFFGETCYESMMRILK